MPKLTMAETAARFGVTRQRVFIWIRQGRVNATWENGIGGPQKGRYLISDRAPKPKPRSPGRKKKEIA